MYIIKTKNLLLTYLLINLIKNNLFFYFTIPGIKLQNVALTSKCKNYQSLFSFSIPLLISII